MNPVIVALLALPALLGTIVVLRMLFTAAKVAKASFRSPVRKMAGPVIPLLDEPSPCPSCEKPEHVHVARSDFREMPYVEHFVCHGCGTQFLGPNQEKMVAKRLDARRVFSETLTGTRKKPATKPGK